MEGNDESHASPLLALVVVSNYAALQKCPLFGVGACVHTWNEPFVAFGNVALIP